ncbi:glycosyltransferase [Nocardia africana]|uniref:glycosyltransferase n=1 Tax=Nocardia africana TaxID=134964 RepID=UPI001D148CF5|nr:glycosyltransferase [Nocardia africana]MCC3312253.1 glycosyltransferase [Nocardia africana]
MPSSDDKTVGLALVTYQSAEDLPGFLETLSAAIEPYTVDVVGIDNVSTDRSAEIVEEFGGRVIRNTRNVGLAAAINQGAAATGGQWSWSPTPTRNCPPARSRRSSTQRRPMTGSA